MSHRLFLFSLILLNFIRLNIAQADDPYEALIRNPNFKGTVTDEMKRNTFDAGRTKQVNQMAVEAHKYNTPAPRDPQYRKMTPAEIEKEMKEVDSPEELKQAKAIEEKLRAEKQAAPTAAKTDTSLAAQKNKKGPDPEPSQAPQTQSIPVKSDKPLDELVFPGK